MQAGIACLKKTTKKNHLDRQEEWQHKAHGSKDELTELKTDPEAVLGFLTLGCWS